MSCIAISNIQSISDLMVYPTGCFYYFYLAIFLSLIFIVAWAIYKNEENKGEGDLIRSLAVTSLSYTILAIFGTYIKGETGALADVPLISSDILLILLSITIGLLMIWIFKAKD